MSYKYKIERDGGGLTPRGCTHIFHLNQNPGYSYYKNGHISFKIRLAEKFFLTYLKNAI